MKNVAFHTLGCKVNIYETEAMQQLMKEAGYRLVDFEDKADVYVINTCSVTNVADKKSRQMLHRAKKLNPSSIVVAAGCYVQSSAEKLKKDENVDIIIGNNMKKDIVSIISAYFDEEKSEEVDVSSDFILDIAKIKEYEEFKVAKYAGHTRAFVKVQDGCNQFCTYCIIPYTRGRVRSRAAADIIQEVKDLVAGGYKELVLTGIHLSSYGIDFTEAYGLIDLIEDIAAVDGLKRIRLGSLEPRIISVEFLERLKKLDNFCPHFHLSLQSGSDKVLQNMNRRYDSEEFAAGVRLIRDCYDEAALTTDVIVGFPGETEEDFLVSKNFIKDIGFYEIHIFPYSRREGTKAAGMKDTLSNKEKSVRLRELADLNARMKSAYLARHMGRELELLSEEVIELDNKKYIVGHSREYIRLAMEYKAETLNKIIKGKVVGFLTDDILSIQPLDEE